MNEVAFRDWLFTVDRDKTKQAYADIPQSSPEACGCELCLNFIAIRQSIYPTEVLDLFGQLGVDYRREAEVYHIAKLESGLHLYGGWLHFIGEISRGPDAPAKVNDHFTIDFLRKRDLAAESFGEEELVQIEIVAEIPWVLSNEKEPS